MKFTQVKKQRTKHEKIIKKFFTILTFLAATSIFATDQYVDPNLSSGNGTTLFTNIASAVAAAVGGDRIIVSSNTYN